MIVCVPATKETVRMCVQNATMKGYEAICNRRKTIMDRRELLKAMFGGFTAASVVKDDEWTSLIRAAEVVPQRDFIFPQGVACSGTYMPENLRNFPCISG